MSTVARTDVVEIEGLATRLKVGMEIHVELCTRTKMWTSAPNVAHPDYFDAEPNTLLDPVVIGMPGVLPVMNRQAVAMSIRVGLALGCEIAAWCKWDRKSYYYPDLPKNYQISQYDLPLCGMGAIDVPVNDRPDAPARTVHITRAHLEEDAGKLLHEAPGGRPIDHSIVDLNRAGTPLLEIVTEPDITSADQAVQFGRTLRNICRFLGVSEGIMQRGHMRFEPNINVVIEKGGQEYATPIVEIKNLNSFRALHGAIVHEHRRQAEQWLADGVTMTPGTKTTRGWDDAKMVTVLQREKEEAHDYRYFPDPDLVPVEVGDDWLAELRAQIPELPLARRKRYVEAYGLDHKQAQQLVDERDVCLFFESIVNAGVDPKRAAAILLNNLSRRANERGCLPSDLGITPRQIATVDAMQRDNRISSNGADELMGACIEAGPEADPAQLADQKGLVQVSDEGALDEWCNAAIDAEPAAAEDVRSGNVKAIGRLVGAVMKLSGGQANPKAVQSRLREKLQG
ncbi:MAG: Asp-tRNA(Asn)/Glu-tRNA(Gln) amidotransferase subunit GatB [Alphaproteobacteria bacterium]|jgi:aspartyl-tRNA(Asn)/glutamyl-tRNA(Gln) amidotransferase subunit B|nr:Asp-tRNA(Asn)/Glu-tRNA(Gln) amidotransferase subunit GatB [Alphaproteobacteria bacterium]